ncbi:MAG: GNAT family N-acetyltransferase [Prevotella sp.]|nr:GNAT family N-acetyltransferase [Prevotella sp.]
MSYIIRKSTLDDLPAMLHIRDIARQTMRRSGNINQWPNGYPPEDAFRRDISLEVSYFVEEEDTQKPLATFAFIPGPDPTYAIIYDGQWLDDEPYCVIHRIAASNEAHGVLSAVLRFCFAQTDNIRIDTHRDNAIMRHLLQKYGFDYCGIIHLENGDERLAYQATKQMFWTTD